MDIGPVSLAALRAFPGAVVREDRIVRAYSNKDGLIVMIDANKIELEAMDRASAKAGEFLASMPTTDLAQFEVEQWKHLIDVIITGYVEHLQSAKMQINDAVMKVSV